MRKLFTFIVALCATTALGASDFEVDGIAYNILGGDSVEVTSKSPKYSDTVTIPATVTYQSQTYRVTSIGDAAFSDCTSLTSVTIPNSVTSIGYWAFSDCTSLGIVTIGNSVTSIGGYAFYACFSLASITIPNSVTSIEKEAFEDCESLVTITIPNSVTSIGDYAFYGCYSLASITVDAANTHYSSEDGVLFTYAKDTLIQYPIGNTRTSYTIPNTVTSIGNSAFTFCTSLASITIPNSVTSIGDYSFYRCSNLPIKNNIRYADTYLVEAVDKSLSTYMINDGTKWIGGEAFYNCSSLTSITIPNSVMSIGNKAFYNCNSLASIIVDAGNTHFCSEDGVLLTYAKNTLIQYPAGNSRTSYTIPNSVTSIGDYAFYKCTPLASITIGNFVKNIGDYAFHLCTTLASIICKTITPPTCGVDCFYKVYKSIPLYVPAESIEAYRDSAEWEDFTNIQAIQLPQYILSVKSNNDIQGVTLGSGLYTIDTTVLITAAPFEGYLFDRWSDGSKAAARYLVLNQDTTLIAYFTDKVKQDTVFVHDTTLVEVHDTTYLNLIEVNSMNPTMGSAVLQAYAIANKGYQFLCWTDFETANPHIVESSDEPQTFTAVFAVDAPTRVSELSSSDINQTRKLLIDGHLYIHRGDTLYNANGQVVE